MRKLLILGICLILAVTSVVVWEKEKKLPEVEKLPPVIVSVKIVGDEEYRFARSDWQKEARELLEAVSEYYQKEFGIRFVATEFVEWISPELHPLPEGVREGIGPGTMPFHLVDTVPSENKIVVALTGEDLSEKGRTQGFALVIERYEGGEIFYTGGPPQGPQRGGILEYYVIVGTDNKNPRNILMHELGHLFGAKHPAEYWGEEYNKLYPSVMDPEKGLEVETFDPKNRKIILANRDKFQGGGP